MINRGVHGPLDFAAMLVNPTGLSMSNTGGGTDIITDASSTIFGDGAVAANLVIPGTLAPGVSSDPGTIGTLDITGDLDASGSEYQVDLSATGGTATSDLVNVSGTATITGATVTPTFHRK